MSQGYFDTNYESVMYQESSVAVTEVGHIDCLFKCNLEMYLTCLLPSLVSELVYI